MMSSCSKIEVLTLWHRLDLEQGGSSKPLVQSVEGRFARQDVRKAIAAAARVAADEIIQMRTLKAEVEKGSM